MHKVASCSPEEEEVATVYHKVLRKISAGPVGSQSSTGSDVTERT
jgi:hypothetical protein